jgi:hypothetical protein
MWKSALKSWNGTRFTKKETAIAAEPIPTYSSLIAVDSGTLSGECVDFDCV